MLLTGQNSFEANTVGGVALAALTLLFIAITSFKKPSRKRLPGEGHHPLALLNDSARELKSQHTESTCLYMGILTLKVGGNTVHS